MTDAVWYYADGGEQKGPVSDEEIANLIASGTVRADTLVWREGMENWAAAKASLPGALVPQSWVDALPPMPHAGTAQQAGYGDAGGYYNPIAFADVIKTVFGRYVQFQGRARRSEYWYWVLFIVLVSIGLAFVAGAIFGFDETDLAIFGPIFSLATFVPSLAVGFRRMHDIGRTAWWLLIGLIPLIGTIVIIYWFVQPGQPSDNQYGPA
ncbi:MAG: DUF805 domain-containing protein [Cohaesibacteraceae bacterium]